MFPCSPFRFGDTAPDRRHRAHIASRVLLSLVVSLAILVSVTLGACRRTTQSLSPCPTTIPTSPAPRCCELPFETIVKGSHSFYEGRDTRLILVYGPPNVPHLSDLPQTVQQTLGALDYRTEMVIALYGGFTGACPFGTGIHRIIYDGETTVRVESTVRSLKITDAECSPYHIVHLKKPEAMIGKRVRFVLVEQGEELIKQEYLIMSEQ